MAKSASRPQKRGHRWILEAAAILLAAAALILGLSLGTYHPTDPSWGVAAPEAPVRNMIGPVGAHLAWSFYEVLGFAAWVLPPLLAAFAALVLLGHRVRAQLPKILGAVLCLCAAASLLEIGFRGSVTLRDGTVRPGGLLGHLLADSLSQWLHVTGAILLAATALFLGILLLTQMSLLEGLQRTGRGLRAMAVGLARACSTLLAALAAMVGGAVRAAGGGLRGLGQGLAHRRAAWSEARARARARREERKEELHKEQTAREAARAAAERHGRPGRTEQEPPAAPDRSPAPQVHHPPEKSPASSPTRPAPLRPGGKDGGFLLPGLDLFEPPDAAGEVDEEHLLENAQRIVAKYAEFGIDGKVLQIHPGPVVTTYEFKPEAGVKYSKITGMSEDLCLALKAESIIIDRIPGKSTVGIEVPNSRRQIIRMLSILESEAYREASSRLTLTLGESIEGEPYVTDLARMPHLLIAGSTGSGKSVSLNAMICSILFRCTPEEVRFILIDPKRLELGLYQDLPHLYTPVVTDPKLAVNALQWAVSEMEDRYRRLAEVSVRNIDQYNRHVRENPGPQAEGEEAPQPIPYVVIVVDELADLMMVTRGGVEESLARLAQMARAVGIHLILATQRPSVDVLTGVIKANFPSRISFRVTSRVDSRTILDSNGAEQLLGKGDLLFLPPGSARLHRLHAPYLTEKEIQRLVGHWKDQAEPSYREDVTAPPVLAEIEREEMEDELYDEAARIVVDRQEASVSYLQRRLRIGYARAARLVDMMEMDGLVGPSPETGGKMREVLVPADYFVEVDAARSG